MKQSERNNSAGLRSSTALLVQCTRINPVTLTSETAKLVALFSQIPVQHVESQVFLPSWISVSVWSLEVVTNLGT